MNNYDYNQFQLTWVFLKLQKHILKHLVQVRCNYYCMNDSITRCVLKFPKKTNELKLVVYVTVEVKIIQSANVVYLKPCYSTGN